MLIFTCKKFLKEHCTFLCTGAAFQYPYYHTIEYFRKRFCQRPQGATCFIFFVMQIPAKMSKFLHSLFTSALIDFFKRLSFRSQRPFQDIINNNKSGERSFWLKRSTFLINPSVQSLKVCAGIYPVFAEIPMIKELPGCPPATSCNLQSATSMLFWLFWPINRELPREHRHTTAVGLRTKWQEGQRKKYNVMRK